MKKIQRQPRVSVSRPPSVGPSAGPTSTTMPKAAWVVACSEAGTDWNRIAWALGSRPPPSNPCRIRASTSTDRLGARPQSIEEAVKPIKQKMK